MDKLDIEYFPHDKEKLLKALTRFDGDVKEEEVIGEADDAFHVNSVLLQILLEAITNEFVKNEEQREIFMTEVWNRLSNLKLFNPSLRMDSKHPLRIQMKRQFYDFLRAVLQEVIPGAEIDRSALSFLESNNVSADPDFCYYKCFEELQEIGRGGFGKVFKARSKLTQHIYAVKKIRFKYKTDIHYLQVIREAKNIATLDHPNVVHYNNAWIEVVPGDSGSSRSTSPDSNSDDSDRLENDQSFCEGASAILIQEEDSDVYTNSSTFESCVGNSSEWNSNESSESVIFSNSAVPSIKVNFTVGSDESSKEDGDNLVTFGSNLNTKISNTNSLPRIPNLTVRGILYIQMEYCDCDLRFWLDARAKGKELPFHMDVTEIFTNILDGLVHIHSKGIMHRDLKPQNIFYSKASNGLKIGDFGLATLANCPFIPNDGHTARFHSANIGTRPYAALLNKLLQYHITQRLILTA